MSNSSTDIIQQFYAEFDKAALKGVYTLSDQYTIWIALNKVSVTTPLEELQHSIRIFYEAFDVSNKSGKMEYTLEQCYKIAALLNLLIKYKKEELELNENFKQIKSEADELPGKAKQIYNQKKQEAQTKTQM